MTRYIPAAHSGRWWPLTAVAAIVITAALWGIRFGLMGQSFEARHALRYVLLAAGLSFFAGVTGWLGMRWLSLLFSAGVLAGLLLMAYYTGDRAGWEDLISLLAFLEALAAGLLAGVVAEIAAWVLRIVRKTRQ